MSSTPDRCLSRKEASALLAISINTLDRLLIPRVMIGRRVVFMMSDLQSYLSKHRVVPVKPVLHRPSAAEFKTMVRRATKRVRGENETPEAIRKRRLRMLGC